MWWFGNDLHEEELRLGVERLEALLGDSAAFAPDLLGFGTALQQERRMLLLVVDQRRDPRPELWMPGSSLYEIVLRRWLRRYDLPLPPGGPAPQATHNNLSVGALAAVGRFGRFWWSLARRLIAVALALGEARRTNPRDGLIARGLAVPLDRADEDSQVLIDRLGLSRNDVLVSYWPKPKATNGHLRGVRRRPTASPGFQLAAEAGERFLATAGHFAVEQSAPVYRSARRFARGPAIGTMRRRLDPRASTEWPIGQHGGADGQIDLGLVELSCDELAAQAVQVQPADEVGEFATFRWDGATSGPTVGQVVGALRMIEVDGVRLANCWFVLGDCRRGDSGAAVVDTSSGRLLGQVVGARGVSRPDGARPGTIVQDAELLVGTAADLLGYAGPQLEVSVLDPL